MRYWNGTGWTAEEAAPAVATNDAAPEPNHRLHLVLTICTCGLWLPAWLAVTLLDPRGARVIRGFVSAHPMLTGIAVLASLIFVLADWKTFALLASFVAVATGLMMSAMLAVRSARRRRQEKAEIAARAEDQHEALLHGDDRWGVFGIKSSAEPFLEPPPTSWRPGRQSLVAGGFVLVGALVFAVTAMVNPRPADRTPRPVSAPTVRVPPPASRPAPPAVLPKPTLNIPFPFLPAPRLAPTSPPALPPAPPVRMGQPAVDGNLTFVVTSVDRSNTVTNSSLPFIQTTAKGTFLTAHLTITNNGKQPEMLLATDQKLRLNAAVYDVDPAAALWTLTLETIVSPGATATGALWFDIPTDTPPGGTLELHESSSSRGATVELLPPK